MSVVGLYSVLAYAVSQRRAEIGILRAIGVGTFKILALFLARAKLAGLLGAGAGYAAGLAAAAAWVPGDAMAEAVRSLARPQWIAAVLVAAPALAGLAAWLPAYGASRQDPADVLRET